MISDHDEIENSLAAFLLGALEPEDEDALRAHLEGCSRCQAVARRLQQALGELPVAAEPLQPPPRLRERILAAAAAARPQGSARPSRSPVIRLPRPSSRAWLRRTAFPGAAAAAVVALALGLGLGFGLGRGLAPPPPQAGAVAQYSMRGSAASAAAVGKVYELKQVGLTLIEFSGLPQPDAGKVYELWLIPASGSPIPAGVFAPDEAGSHVVVVARNLSGVKVLALTQENAPDGASAPTQQPQITGSV